MAYIKNFTPSNKSLKRHSIIMALGVMASCFSNPSTTTYIEPYKTYLTGAESYGSYYYDFNSSVMWMPTRSRRIKNKIMRKRLCKH